MRPGDIVTVAGGGYTSKPRPALVLQDDRFDATDSLTVCPVTTLDLDASLIRVPIEATEETGLDRASFLMVDKVTTIRRSNVGDSLGRLDSSSFIELERRLLVFLGFGA